ncbi:MAG: DUF4249 domain-containing protein [Saprospiraceae bacterium]
MKKIFFLLFLSSIALVSCEDFFSQTVEIDPPPYDKQLSFHLNLSNLDSSVRVVLTRNFGILETVPNYNDFFVKGGAADIYKDGEKWISLAPLSSDSSFVLLADLPNPLQPGSTYEIRATHPEFPAVMASQTMPGDFVVDSARIKYNASSGPDGERYDHIEVFLQDQAGVRNFYEVSISTFYYYTTYNPNTGTLDTIDVYEYPTYPDGFTDANVVFGVKGGGLVTDQFFDGQSYKFVARVYSGNEAYRVHVRNITEDYYRWSRSYQAKDDAEDNPLVEPVSVFNNLVNGLGIFSVAWEKEIKVK